MNKKIIKRILIIILLFMIFVVAYKLVNTYALFYSEGNGVIEQKNATWRIYVNNQNITSKNSNKFTVDTFNLEENNHVAPGKIAPNTTGSFNLLIDPKNTDVSVKYSVKLDKTKLINLPFCGVAILTEIWYDVPTYRKGELLCFICCLRCLRLRSSQLIS